MSVAEDNAYSPTQAAGKKPAGGIVAAVCSLNITLLFVISMAMVGGSQLYGGVLVSKISDETIEKIIQASSFTRAYDGAEISPRKADDLVKVGAPRWAQREGVKAVLQTARRHGLSLIDQAVLLATAEIESGFNPMARAGNTTACGLFQFIKTTGEQYGLDPGSCMDPWLNSRAAIQHYRELYNERVVNKVRGLEGTERLFRTFELSYYLHHDGPRSTNPEDDVKAVVIQATPFLLRAYALLEAEQQAHQGSSDFSGIFAEELVKAIGSAAFRVGTALGLY